MAGGGWSPEKLIDGEVDMTFARLVAASGPAIEGSA
jgi:hypothetical protein